MVAPSLSPRAGIRCNACGTSLASLTAPCRCKNVHGERDRFAPPPSMPTKAGVVATRAAAGTRCILGHAHDSKGEAAACPLVHARAAHLGLTTFRPGRPGLPCFRVAADDNGRPAYVSVDWVLVDAAGRVALFVDYKGAVAKSKRLDKGWARGKRIVEAEYGVPVVELTTPEEANHIPREPKS